MSHVGSSIESLFAGRASPIESPNTPNALFVTSVVDTAVVLESIVLFVPAVALGAVADATTGFGAVLLESPTMRFGAPATMTVRGCGVVSGCE